MDIFYSSALSPFAARVRMAAMVSGAALPEMVAPPGGTGSPAMRAINPFGQVPAILVGGRVLIESLALMEFVAETEVANTLLPTDSVSRARVRGIAAAHDHQVFPAMLPVLGQLRVTLPDPGVIAAGFEAAAIKLSALTSLFDPDGLAVGNTVSLADLAIAPFALMSDELARMFGVPTPYRTVARAASWWAAARAVPVIAADTERRAAEFRKMFGSRPAKQQPI